MILSTEDHQELMKAVAAKTSSQLSLLPPVSSTGADHTSSQETEISHTVSGVFSFIIICTCSACYLLNLDMYLMLHFQEMILR